MHFERGRRNLPIHRATDARSIRRILPDGAACPGCYTHHATSVGDEILNVVARVRRMTQGRSAAPSAESLGVARRP